MSILESLSQFFRSAPLELPADVVASARKLRTECENVLAATEHEPYSGYRELLRDSIRLIVEMEELGENPTHLTKKKIAEFEYRARVLTSKIKRKERVENQRRFEAARMAEEGNRRAMR